MAARAAALLVCAELAGCAALLPPPETPRHASFVVTSQHYPWPGSLEELTTRVKPALEKHGAVLERLTTESAKYRVAGRASGSRLVLQRDAAGVTLRMVARGPYSGALALRISAWKRALRLATANGGANEAAAAAAAIPTPADPVPATGPTPSSNDVKAPSTTKQGKPL